MSLDDVVTSIAKVVADRAAQGNNFGTVLIPEGLVEFIPAMKRLIAELNDFWLQMQKSSLRSRNLINVITSSVSCLRKTLLSMQVCRKV